MVSPLSQSPWLLFLWDPEKADIVAWPCIGDKSWPVRRPISSISSFKGHEKVFFRIFYVSHDSQDLNVFSYIVRENQNDSLRCIVFKARRKVESSTYERNFYVIGILTKSQQLFFKLEWGNANCQNHRTGIWCLSSAWTKKRKQTEFAGQQGSIPEEDALREYSCHYCHFHQRKPPRICLFQFVGSWRDVSSYCSLSQHSAN
jgi:hypothetical protein